MVRGLTMASKMEPSAQFVSGGAALFDLSIARAVALQSREISCAMTEASWLSLSA